MAEERQLDDLLELIDASESETTSDASTNDTEDIQAEVVSSQDIVKGMAKSGSLTEEYLKKFLEDTDNFKYATEFRAYLENIKSEIINNMFNKTEDKTFITQVMIPSIKAISLYSICEKLAKVEGIASAKIKSDPENKDDHIKKKKEIKAGIVLPLFQYADMDVDKIKSVIESV